jgi:aldehyde dehydrogenase family 7 protein A1
MLRSRIVGYGGRTITSMHSSNLIAHRYSSSASANTARRVLQELGLKDENPGVYNGHWSGNGQLVESVNPATGQTLAHVRTVSAIKDLNVAVTYMLDDYD